MKKLSARRRHPLAALVVLLFALAATGGLYAVLAPADEAEADTSAQSLAIEEGERLYEVGCSSCHGTDGQGSSDGPSLVGVGAAAVDFQVGTGRMPLQQHGPEAARKPPVFDELQIQQLATYVASLGAGPAIPESLNYQSADVAYGGALFRTNCAQCHNFAGSGGALTYGKYAPTLHKATPKQIYEAMITGPENMPVFGDHEITASQKLAIINYIEEIKKQPDPGGAGLGRVGPVTETAVAWLVGIGGLVIITMWIGSKV